MDREQKPSIGRIVIYRPDCVDVPEVGGGKPEITDKPALITRVEKNGNVSLAVFWPMTIEYRHNVPLALAPAGKEFGDGGAGRPPSGTWRWPKRV